MKLYRKLFSKNNKEESLNVERLISGGVGGLAAGTILSGEKHKLKKLVAEHEIKKTLKRDIPVSKLLKKLKRTGIGVGVGAGSAYLIGKEISKPKVRKDAIDYVKKNPDEAAVMVGSYTVPGYVGAKLMKNGNKKLGGAVMAATALPLGEGYIVGKKAIQSSMEKDSEKKK